MREPYCSLSWEFFHTFIRNWTNTGAFDDKNKKLIINLHYAMNVFVWCYHIMSRPAVKKKITSIEFHWGSKNSEFYHLISYSSSHLFYSAFILQYRSWNESLLYFEDVLERAIKFYRLVPKKNKGYINNLMPASWNI